MIRDSYLPQGSQGLKEVTRLKLQYQPVEVAPEEMVEKAINEPQVCHSRLMSTYFSQLIYLHFLLINLDNGGVLSIRFSGDVLYLYEIRRSIYLFIVLYYSYES